MMKYAICNISMIINNEPQNYIIQLEKKKLRIDITNNNIL